MFTPLWPAGHLPLKGGDQLPLTTTPVTSVAKEAKLLRPPIFPLEGEMSPKATEGGVSSGEPS